MNIWITLHQEQTMTGKEEEANNYSGGRYTVGRVIINLLLDPVSNRSQQGTNFHRFLLFNSFGG
jgi:hypothetical protein